MDLKSVKDPADERFPEGYGRAEALAGLVIVIFLAFISFEIMDTAHHKLQNPGAIVVPDNYVLLMAVLGIVFNYIISSYIIKIGREISSPAIEADGHHQRADIFTSIAILIGVAVAKMGFPILDPIIGFFIGLLILRTAYKIGKRNILYIMGFDPEKEKLVSEIKDIVDNTPGVSDAHNIIMDSFASYVTVTMHIHVDGNLTVREAYELSSQLEKDIILKLPKVMDVSAKPCPFNDEHD